MSDRPPAPYPDGTPDYWASVVLRQGERGEGTFSKLGDGDFVFYSGRWQTIHGEAVAARSDRGAFMAWDARLPDGRRVHCRRGGGLSPGANGLWRRRSDDGRSWVSGQIRFTETEIFFTDGRAHLLPVTLEANAFERSVAGNVDFIAALQDDSFAFTLNRALWVEALCTLDASMFWTPSGRGDAAETIARLRSFGEIWADFKYGGPEPNPPAMDIDIIDAALAAAGWRFQNDEEYRRFNPEMIRKI